MMTPQQIAAERERIQQEMEFYRDALRWWERRKEKEKRNATATARNR